MKISYKTTLRPLLFLLSPDSAHQVASWALRMAGRSSLLKWVVGKMLSFNHPSLESNIGGVFFPCPVGLPAGFDPNGDQAPIYSSLGFGFATVGSATFMAQQGNPRPHHFRLVKDEALIVHKGLMNQGAESLARKIKVMRQQNKISYPLGISLARTTNLPPEDTADDYLKSFRCVFPFASYIEINVSCPNVACFSPDEQVMYIDDILSGVQKIKAGMKSKVPVWLKLGPDLSDEWNKKIIAICLKRKIDGVVLTNLIKDRTQLNILSKGWEKMPGGISGKVLAPFSEQRLEFFYKRLKGRIPLISVGGVFTAEDVYRRIGKGASLIQMLTGWIYEGPFVLRRINKQLVSFLKNDGFESIADAVGNQVNAKHSK